MFTSNSIRLVYSLLCSLLFVITGCAEKTTKHVFMSEIAPPVEQQIYTGSFQAESNNDNKSIVDAPLIQVDSVVEDNPVSIVDSVVKVEHKTVWDRLFSLYTMPEIDNHRIEREVQRYLKHPKFLTKLQQRAEPYLHFILDEIEAKKLPGEFALLPVVESAFIPDARSKSSALGLWQFMPVTGRVFGLEQNWWYDGRKDIYKSTQAAATYLKQLSELHNGDWALALASYNAGNGYIRKAIRRNKKKNRSTDYWSLSLHKETMGYVPKLMAIAKIFAHAKDYKIPLLDIPNKPYFSIVSIDSPLDLDIAAKIAKMPVDDFVKLNPAFKRSRVNKKGSYQLLVKAGMEEGFKSRLANTPKKDWIKPSLRHKVKSGENLGVIAQKYNTSVYALRKNNRLASNMIKVGQLIHIPGLLDKKGATYTVKRGDTFWNIARQFAVRSKDIASWNHISLTTALQPGQKLIIEES